MPSNPASTLARRLAAEGIGTALLLSGVVGSGIMAERLAGGNAAIALLANALATGCLLVALILVFGPVSGAHFNPVVSAVEAATGGLAGRYLSWYLAVQALGAMAGVALAHGMFGLAAFTASTHVRSGPSQLLSEVVATFGLVAVIKGCAAHRPGAIPFAVGAYITAAYWFTASTSFANPAVTLARAFTDTFSGIRPGDIPAFMAAQAAGAALSAAFMGWLLRPQSPPLPHNPNAKD